MGNLFKIDDNRINNAGIATQIFNVNQNKQLLLQTADFITLNSMKTKKKKIQDQNVTGFQFPENKYFRSCQEMFEFRNSGY